MGKKARSHPLHADPCPPGPQDPRSRTMGRSGEEEAGGNEAFGAWEYCNLGWCAGRGPEIRWELQEGVALRERRRIRAFQEGRSLGEGQGLRQGRKALPKGGAISGIEAPY